MSILKRKVSWQVATSIISFEVLLFLFAFGLGIYQGVNTVITKAAGDVNVPAGSYYKYDGHNFGMVTSGGSVFLGGAGNLTMTGTGNTAIGSQSFGVNTTGVANTVLGGQALPVNKTGNGNIAVGFHSLVSNSAGNSNTAVGDTSLGNNGTGSLNTAIGYNAGILANTNNSLYLGANTIPLNGEDTNEIVIGYNAKGAGSNTVTLGNSSILKTLLQGNVGIGIANPGIYYGQQAKLDVNGYASFGGLRINGNDVAYNTIYQTKAIGIKTAGGGILISSAGNVGIGTNTPVAKLDVDGAIRTVPNTSSTPACSASNEGSIYYCKIGSCSTHFMGCRITTSGTYQWLQLDN